MASELNTIGIKLKYAASATGTTKPTTGYTEIPNITSIGELNLTPDQLEVTDLSDTIKRYIDGVQDPNGGNLSIGYNMTAAFKTAWQGAITAYETAHAASKGFWWEIVIPNMDSYYVAGKPGDLGFPGAEVNQVLAGTVSIILNEVAGFAAASTV